ncbi:hypothetical protein TRIUR3_06934 [Triticum urartu]|uniref:Uncharacterized protein n=1 Tax=Triticum urartu TaxID=4572 RepID=M7Z9D4_TRIUA|nr:hypothetical protein TRIUR3_06934 [Triticum urartu]
MADLLVQEQPIDDDAPDAEVGESSETDTPFRGGVFQTESEKTVLLGKDSIQSTSAREKRTSAEEVSQQQLKGTQQQEKVSQQQEERIVGAVRKKEAAVAGGLGSVYKVTLHFVILHLKVTHHTKTRLELRVVLVPDWLILSIRQLSHNMAHYTTSIDYA